MRIFSESGSSCSGSTVSLIPPSYLASVILLAERIELALRADRLQ